MTLTKTGATPYYAQFGLPDKGRVIKGFDVCTSWVVSALGPATIKNRQTIRLNQVLIMGKIKQLPIDLLLNPWTTQLNLSGIKEFIDIYRII